MEEEYEKLTVEDWVKLMDGNTPPQNVVDLESDTSETSDNENEVDSGTVNIFEN